MWLFEVQTIANNDEHLFNEKFCMIIVSYIDEWTSILEGAHCRGQCHQLYLGTYSTIVEQGWLVGAQVNGILRLYTEEFIKIC